LRGTTERYSKGAEAVVVVVESDCGVAHVKHVALAAETGEARIRMKSVCDEFIVLYQYRKARRIAE
jgi:hypothetical protein